MVSFHLIDLGPRASLRFQACDGPSSQLTRKGHIISRFLLLELSSSCSFGVQLKIKLDIKQRRDEKNNNLQRGGQSMLLLLL